MPSIVKQGCIGQSAADTFNRGVSSRKQDGRREKSRDLVDFLVCIFQREQAFLRIGNSGATAKTCSMREKRTLSSESAAEFVQGNSVA